MEKGKKCPNCGYVSTKNEEFCPNCDRFEPAFDDTKELADKAIHKPEPDVADSQSEYVETPEAIEPEVEADISEPVENVEEVVSAPLIEPVVEATEPQIEKFAAKEVIPEDPYGAKVEPTAKESERPKKQTTASLPVDDAPTPPKKNYNKLIALVALLALLIGGGLFGYNKYQGKKEADQVAALKKEGALLENELDKLYLNEEKVFLSETFSEEALKDLEDQVAEFKGDSAADLKPVVKDLRSRADLLASVNNLFKEPIVKGDKLVENSVLKQAEATVPKEIEKPADKFEELINKGLKVANDQVAANKKAKELVAKVYGDEAKKEATRAQYDEAKEAVKKLKDDSLQKDFDTKLTKVDTLIKEEEKKEAQRKEDEQQAAIAQAQASLNAAPAPQPQADPYSAPNNIGQGTYTGGISLPNEASGTTYGDWSWGEGIQAKVINECIRRGYIVEGGYELRQRTIINGEAYYDLYATSTQSSLLKDRSASELPIYLVTINAKTGWFKGEGPN